MKIYRFHFYEGNDGSTGFGYYTSRGAAEAAARAWVKQCQQDDDRASAMMGINSEIEEIDVVLTKKGVIELLESWAAHPSNG
jgi:hypothetical protein